MVLTRVRKIVKAQSWLEIVIYGMSFAEIAKAGNTRKLLVHDVVSLVLLAPEFLDAIVVGQQATVLTSDYLINRAIRQIGQSNSSRSAASELKPSANQNSYRGTTQKRLEAEFARCSKFVPVSETESKHQATENLR